MRQQVLMIMTEQSSGLAALDQKSVNTNNQHKSMSWTVCYDNTCQTHQSDKNDSEWYLKSLKQSLHVTQVKKNVDSLNSRSDSEESYEMIKFSTTKKKLRENHYFSDDSQKDFS